MPDHRPRLDLPFARATEQRVVLGRLCYRDGSLSAASNDRSLGRTISPFIDSRSARCPHKARPSGTRSRSPKVGRSWANYRWTHRLVSTPSAEPCPLRLGTVLSPESIDLFRVEISIGLEIFRAF